MRKLILVFALAFFVFHPPVFADYNSSYNDYVYNYQLYRTALGDFQIARSSYRTYRTLNAQNDAITKFRSLLKARNQVYFAYYSLLQEKLNTTDGVSADSKATFDKIKKSEQTWLTDNQKKIDAASSFEDLNSVSGEFDSHYSQLDSETKHTIGDILIAKEIVIKNKEDTLLGTLSDKLAQIRSSGEDTSSADRGILVVRNKLDLYDQKVQSAQNIFSGTNQSGSESRVDLFAGQQRLGEANQYLRETNNLLQQIVKSYTGN